MTSVASHTTDPTGRRLLILDPYALCGGELASDALREQAAKLHPFSLGRAVLLEIAAELDDITRLSLAGTEVV